MCREIKIEQSLIVTCLSGTYSPSGKIMGSCCQIYQLSIEFSLGLVKRKPAGAEVPCRPTWGETATLGRLDAVTQLHPELSPRFEDPLGCMPEYYCFFSLR